LSAADSTTPVWFSVTLNLNPQYIDNRQEVDMKRFFVSLISTILAFTAGLVTASSWNSKSATVAPVIVNAAPPCPPNQPKPTVNVNSYSVTPPREFEFGQNGLRLVPERVQLKSESLSYDIDVSYPQLVGTPVTKETVIRKVNQHLKEGATKLYQWPLKPSAQLGYSQAQSGIRNTVAFTYQVGLATDSLLSVNFIGYGYDGMSNNQLQDGFTANYDLTTGKALKLSDLFKPRSGYMEFISRYCIDEIKYLRSPDNENLRPSSENFEAWQVTSNGIRFNFPACRVASCSEGEVTLDISFDTLKPMLDPGIPGKFNITYP
jgi:hypothetical protein